jgi:hypothetical protein
MAEILRRSTALKPGEIFELQTPFVPAPIIDMLKEKGFRVFSVPEGSSIFSYISK